MSRPLRTAAFLLYTVLIVCAILAAAEYLARAYTSSRHRGTAQSPLILDRWAAYRNNPAYQRPWLHHTSAGFRRDREVSVQKPANTVRVFLAGGSVAYGAGTLYPEIDNTFQISDHETIDYFLEQKLNAAFPDRRWEVINAAVRGYRLHQDLALILSTLLRYKPHFIVLLDGVNDMIGYLDESERGDPYTETQLREEFDLLTDPRSFRSLRVSFSTWLENNSALYQMLRERLLRQAFMRTREREMEARVVPAQVEWNDLSGADQKKYTTARAELASYLRVVHQIHEILQIDGVGHAFALQPHLLVTHKTLAGSEPRLLAYHRTVVGPLGIYGFETLYPELAARLASDSAEMKYRFLNLGPVFDGMKQQAFTDECHLTPDGDRAIADALFDQLKDSFKALKP